MSHSKRILALPADTLLYNIHTKERYVMEHLKPIWIDLAKSKASQMLHKPTGEVVDIAFLRPVGEKVWLKAKVYGDFR